MTSGTVTARNYPAFTVYRGFGMVPQIRSLSGHPNNKGHPNSEVSSSYRPISSCGAMPCHAMRMLSSLNSCAVVRRASNAFTLTLWAWPISYASGMYSQTEYSCAASPQSYWTFDFGDVVRKVMRVGTLVEFVDVEAHSLAPR